MTHSVTALLGPEPVLREFAAKERVPGPVQAKAGVWLLPLTEDVIDTVVGLPLGEPFAGFTYLFPKLLTKLKGVAGSDWIIYAETDYFGGVGTQGAVAIQGGEILYGPEASEWGCINKALSSVGIQVLPPAQDEFDTIGFGLQRLTEDWLR